MIRDPNNPNSMYFMLTEDDMMMKDDEYYDFTEDRWIKINISHIGDLYKGPYEYEHFLIIRRKNSKFEHNHGHWI